MERLDRLIREKQIPSDRELSRKAKLSEGAIASLRTALKKGKDPDPQMSTLIGLSQAFKVSLDYLCLGYERSTGAGYKSAKDIAIMQARDSGVPEAAIEAVVSMPDEVALTVEVWQLRIETAHAELRARGRGKRRVHAPPSDRT